MTTSVRTLTVTLAGIAALVLTGCGPRQAPDASLRMTPVSTPPVATVHVDIKAKPMSPDSGGRAATSFVLAIVPVVSAISPSFGADNLEAGSVGYAVAQELQATKTVTIVPAGQADYIVTGSAESRTQQRLHMCGLGIAWAAALLPAGLGVPYKTYTVEAEADIRVVRRRDGGEILDTSVSSDTWWTRNGYNADPVDWNLSAINRSVCVPEVGMTAAKRIALAIQSDMATQSRHATPTPAAAAPAAAPAEAQ